jgi:hypothetical protein
MSIALVKETFKVTAPQRNQQFSSSTSRYGGSIQSSESLANGVVGASLMLSGATATEAIDNWEYIISTLESGDSTQYYIRWQPENASNSVYYEVRGLASWQAQYKWIEFQSNKSLVFEVSWPVAPLARGLSTTFSAGSITSPATTSSITVGGTAPALLDVSVTNPTGKWAMLSWSKHTAATTTTSKVGYTAAIKPFGVLEVESGTGTYSVCPGGTVATGQSDALNGTKANWTIPTSASSATTYMNINPSLMQPDSFSTQTVDLEIWIRAYIANTRPPTLSAFVTDDTSSVIWTAEYGSAGKAVPAPLSSGWRFIKAGTITLPTNSTAPFELGVQANFAAGSSAIAYSVDYIVCNPAKARAMSPTGKQASDPSYPSFNDPSGLTTKKLIKSNLSAQSQASSSTSQYTPSVGLGGNIIEVPVGSVDLFFKMSAAVPDDPTSNATADTLSAATTVAGTITPRYYLARGS